MIIKKYGDIPRTYAPDPGEVVNARRSAADKYTKAAVVNVRRRRDGSLKVRVQWMATNEGAGVTGVPVRAGEQGWIVIPQGDSPPMIEQISRGEPSA